MYCSDSFLISSRRQVHWDVEVMRVPSSFLKGSGSLALEVSEPGRDTAQPAPSSSTVDAVAACAVVLLTKTRIAPTAASTAIRAAATIDLRDRRRGTCTATPS